MADGLAGACAKATPRLAAVAGTARMLLVLAPLCMAPACRAQSAPPEPAPAATGAAARPQAADADAAVLLYGIVDAGVRHINSVSPAGAATLLASGLNTSRFGLRGTQTLGAGLRAGFRLEGGFHSGNGAQSDSAARFDRSAIVALGGDSWNAAVGRQEGFGYELAASGATDPLQMALNLPNYSSPAAAESKAPVLGANPLQSLYSYTYGQLRFNNALRLTASNGNFSGGVMAALGGVAGNFPSAGVRAAQCGLFAGPARAHALIQQSVDLHGVRSTLAVLAGAWDSQALRLQAGVHDLRIGAGFDSAGLGNGAASSGILGSSTIVSPALAGSRQEFHFAVADAGASWRVTPVNPVTLALYKTRTAGAAGGGSLAQVLLAKWLLSRKTTLYMELDHATASGALDNKPVSATASAVAGMFGVNVRF